MGLEQSLIISQTTSMTKELSPQSQIDILTLNRLLVLNENGQEILISSFWKSNPVVIIFLRHFGCIACRAQVDKVWKNKEALQKTGNKIIFVGNGTAEMINGFKEELNIMDAPIFTDPTMEIFDACGLNRGLKYLLNAKAILQAGKLYKEGYTQGTQKKENGAHTQMGGIMAIKPPGQVTYHFASEYLGDFDDSSKWSESN
jgi:peroxiredoxin